MKYIRTRDGIVYVGDLVKDEFGNYCKAETIETDMEVDGKHIINEADTIEELCDEIVVDCKLNIRHKPFIHILSPKTYSNNKVFYKSNDAVKKETAIYGAIWTDIGLIYVAKMNDKGELELI